MRTNLAEIDTLSVAALNRVHENPNVPPIHKALAGFEVLDKEKHQRETEHRRRTIDRYRSDREALIDALRESHVTPLAVIPAKIWNQICRNAGLFRFAPDSDGKVYVNTSDADRYWNVAGFLTFVLCAIPVALTIFGMTQIGHWGNWHFGNYALVVALAAQVITGFAMIGQGYVHIQKRIAKMTTRRLDRANNHAYAMSRLFPDLTDPVANGQTTSKNELKKAKLILPPVPAEIGEILERVSQNKLKLNMHVAVVPEAFRLEQKPSELFTDIYGKKAEARIEYLKSLDPIVYVVRDGMVAVIAQFGDFPIEREVVEAALEQEDCLL